MIKSDLINEVIKRTGLSRREAAHGVEATLRAIKRGLSQGGSLHIRGLGRLQARPKRARAGLIVKLKATRNSITSFNSSPCVSIEPRRGGNMEKGEVTAQAEQVEGSALGLDIGTSRLVLASGSAYHVKTTAELNAFLTIPYSKFTEGILKQNKVNYQLNGGREITIYGNDAERFANFFNAEVRRPMMSGMLNPAEECSLSVIQATVQLLMRKAKRGDSLRFSIPGISYGEAGAQSPGESELVYHEAMLKNILTSMGYNAKSVNEGLAVVFSELADDNFTGIGISCGGGMCNVCLAFMSVPVLTFSTVKAGDYIDRSVAAVTGEKPTRIRAIKEEGLDLSRSPQNKYESALHVYYDDVIVSLVETLRKALVETKNLPRIDRPIPIVLSGGTALPKGFVEKFRHALERDGFPLAISDIRLANSPLTATARGCLIAALYDA
jgi:nucleoid DNA-binding protein